MRYLIGFLFVILLTGQALSQEEDPGYVDFNSLDIPFDSDSSVEVLLKPPLLRLIAESTREEDPGFANLLDGLYLIHMQTFPFDPSDAERVNERVTRSADRFERTQGWERVARVRERKASSLISVKTRRDRIVGLLLIVVEETHQVVYINIVGEIDLLQIGRIGRKFKLSQLENMKLPKKR